MEETQKKPKSTTRFMLEIVEIIIIALALSWLLRTFIMDARFVPSGSMLPTIQIGDRLVVDKFFYKHFGSIERNDIIVFHPPATAHDLEDDYIKRVIALPGDTLEVKSHKVYLNGEELTEPFIMQVTVGDYGPITVPEGSLFVMGDNRNASSDSRDWGLLPIENVVGKAFVRYWPLNSFGGLS